MFCATHKFAWTNNALDARAYRSFPLSQNAVLGRGFDKETRRVQAFDVRQLQARKACVYSSGGDCVEHVSVVLLQLSKCGVMTFLFSWEWVAHCFVLFFACTKYVRVHDRVISTLLGRCGW